jgi:hypothetical protein
MLIDAHQVNTRRCIPSPGGDTVTSKAKAPVLENTLRKAVANPTESGFLSRPIFGAGASASPHDFGLDGRSGNARRTSLRVFSTSSPPVLLENNACGFESRKGAKTMTPMTPEARQRAAYALARQVPDLPFGFSIQTDHGPIHIPHGPTAKRIAALVEKMLRAELADAAKTGGAA